MDRGEWMARIRDNIRRTGWHTYQILAGPTPSWTYSIGFEETFGSPEVVVAGANYFSRQEIAQLFQDLGTRLASGEALPDDGAALAPFGAVEFVEADPTWVDHLLLGALDYYGGHNFSTLQLLPDARYRTIDTPDMSHMFDPSTAGPWRWLTEEWPYPVSKRTVVITDLDALRGAPLLDVTCYPGDEGPDWEAFATRPDAPQIELVRAAPFGALVGHDPTLAPALEMTPGETAHRPSGSAPWEIRRFG